MDDAEGRTGGARALAERVADRLAGDPGVVRLRVVLATYDRAGGGLVAGGLAYTSLLALLPGLLLGLSAAGYLIRDPADQEHVVVLIAQALPPLEEVARAAFRQVSSGAVPSGIVAIIGLLWGSSRFYANLDTAFSRIFLGAPRRNPVVQTLRGVVLTVALVVVPVALVSVGSIVTWLTQFAPDGVSLSQLGAVALDIASPVGSLLAFSFVVALCYRYVPSQRLPWRAILPPAGATGLVLAVLTQVYTLVAPRLVGAAALYGAFVAVFALLAWLSTAFNMLLLGAAWTDARARLGLYVDVALQGQLRRGDPAE